MKEEEVLNRIQKASLDYSATVSLESTLGYALFDMYIERRGNLYREEVYRLTKARDSTTPKTTASLRKRNNTMFDQNDLVQLLPPNHKFTNNDVILLTLQPSGSGDFFFNPPAISSLMEDLQPGNTATTTSRGTQILSSATSVEARVLNTGPSYIDIVMTAGSFEQCFQQPASNDKSGEGNKRLRLRVDKFFSDVPYQRMVSALSQITASTRSEQTTTASGHKTVATNVDSTNMLRMDPIFCEVILSTFSSNMSSSGIVPIDDTKTTELSNRLSQPPLGQISQKLAKEVINYIQHTSPNKMFRPFNLPQLTAIESALTRRLTMIQGPPGTGKTACAAAITFGFVHQCRSLNPLPKKDLSSNINQKVLACAFSNVGADNIAESLLQLGMKIVRVGKPSAVSESLWNYTLEAAIDRDPDAQKAVQNAASVSATAGPQGRSSTTQHPSRDERKGSHGVSQWNHGRLATSAVTLAVKASIEASSKAATKALREADVIVSTLTGASDPRILEACGIIVDDGAESNNKNTKQRRGRTQSKNEKKGKIENGGNTLASVNSGRREIALDGLPPLSIPFVVIDEACQSFEAATLIPIVATNSCRSVVLLGDPCQLPPTVRNREAMPSLSLSLMERLASSLHISQHRPKPHHVVKVTEMDDTYLNSRPIRQSVSLIQSWAKDYNGSRGKRSYRKTYNGSFLLSIQYRMHPSIAALPSAIFYDSLLTTPVFMNEIRTFPYELKKFFSKKLNNSDVCVRFIDVHGKDNERRGMLPSSTLPTTRSPYFSISETPASTNSTCIGPRTSSTSLDEDQTTYWNEAEANCVLSLLKEIVMQQKNKASDYTTSSNRNTVSTIGVITPYLGQVQLIKSLLADDCFIRESTPTIEVKSVDGYQGRERDLIIFSAVRSNRNQNIGFLHDWRRMNVALTRAKSALVVVGDMECLSSADKNWAAFAKWINGVQGVICHKSIGNVD